MLEVLKVDVVLLDIDMPIINGIDATREVKKRFPEVKIIMLTMHDEEAMIKSLLDIGADGYLSKNSSREELVNAIQDVINGNPYISEEVNSLLLRSDGEQHRNGALADLTERDIEILKCVSEGLSNKEIGEKLFISHRTS